MNERLCEKLKIKSVEQARETVSREIITTENKFNLFYSGRGVGKTFSVQIPTIDECIENGGEIGFCVLKDKEINNNALLGWISKVWNFKYKDFYDLRQFNKREIFYTVKGENNFKRLFYCFSITNADDYKVFSFPEMRFLIWDECVKERLRPEDKNAMSNFINIYETVDREENRVKAVLMCNVLKTAKISPVFDYFNVPANVQIGDKITYNGRTSIYLPTFGAEKKKFVNDTGGYAIMSKGEFDISHYGYLIKIPALNEKAVTTFIIAENDIHQYIFTITNQQNIYVESLSVSENFDFLKFTINPAFVTDKTPYLNYYIKSYLKKALENGKLKFINEETLLRANDLIYQITNIKLL